MSSRCSTIGGCEEGFSNFRMVGGYDKGHPVKAD